LTVTTLVFVVTFGFTTCKLDDILLDLYIPSHFYTVQEIFETNDGTCTIYCNGYAISQNNKLVKVVGSKRLNNTGTESFNIAPGFDVSERLNAGWVVRKAESSIAGKTAVQISLLFEQKYAELANWIGYDGNPRTGNFAGPEGFNAGVYIDRPIGILEESIWIPLGWGDSTGEYKLWINVPGVSFLVYNRQQAKVFIVKDELVKIWQPNWGDPVNDRGNHGFKVNGQDFTRDSQLFINGYVHTVDSAPVWVPAEYAYVGGEHTYTLK
jgi:hypothetical protein